MKKYFLGVAILAFAPSIAFASWWNPISWDWASFFNGTVGQTEVQNPVVTPESQSVAPTPIVSDTSINSNTPVAPKTTQKTITKISQPTTNPPVTTSSVPAPVQPKYISLPVISSASNGVISGQGFTGATSVYIYSVSQIDVPFIVVNDTTIDISNPSTPVAPGNYNLYVLNSQGTSASFPIYIAPSQEQQTYTQQPAAPAISATCQAAQQQVQSAQSDYNTYAQYDQTVMSNPNAAAEFSSGRGVAAGESIANTLDAKSEAVTEAMQEEQIACQ